MSIQDSNLKRLLSPSRSGTFFAPFRSRSANPEGFDSKMKLWITAIEEWAVLRRRLTLSLKDIHETFISDSGIHPDKECIRLVLSEMKRRSRLVPLNSLKNSNFWTSSASWPFLDNFIDPKGWLSWGVKTLVYTPASWAMSAMVSGQDQTYTDLTDMSIKDTMKFVSLKTLTVLSQNLLIELVRISKAEKQSCFEWNHLLELITPIMNTIVDTADGKELLEMLDILIEYLATKKQVAVHLDNETKLVKIANPEDPKEDEVMITRKDIDMARLLKAKELLMADVDKYHDQAQGAKQDAMECYSKKELTKAKFLLRTHKRLTSYADQKEAQLTNVQIMLEQLETTDSNILVLEAYKDGAEALKVANTNIESNMTILDDMYDATAEARHLNEEMNQMLNDISQISVGNRDTTELETELRELIADNDQSVPPTKDDEPNFDEELERRLNSLVVCQDDPNETLSDGETRLKTKNPIKSTAT